MRVWVPELVVLKCVCARQVEGRKHRNLMFFQEKAAECASTVLNREFPTM